MQVIRVIVVAVLLIAGLPLTGKTSSISVAKTDKCPVCGMFVAKYPDFLTKITFTDGTYAVFDGAKDMFKYYFNLKKYNAAKELSDIASIAVTDYYEMSSINGREAWFVVGSDVYGPMGRELMPFTGEADAQGFLKDHSGKKILRFDEVTPAVINGLDSP